MRFRVTNSDGSKPDLRQIALEEEWAMLLSFSDMQGFAITDDGGLALLDECGCYRWCPPGRFKVEWLEQ